MRCVDVNVLVYAHRQDLPEHAQYSRLLNRWANDQEPLGLPDIVLSGFIRVITNRRIFAEPTGAAALAGAVALAEKGLVDRGSTVVVPVTGSGFKDLDVANGSFERPAVIEGSEDDLKEISQSLR